MNVDDITLRSLNQNLQTLQMKDVPGENISTIASYLLGSLLLLEKLAGLPKDTMGLLNNMMCSGAMNSLAL